MFTSKETTKSKDHLCGRTDLIGKQSNLPTIIASIVLVVLIAVVAINALTIQDFAADMPTETEEVVEERDPNIPTHVVDPSSITFTDAPMYTFTYITETEPTVEDVEEFDFVDYLGDDYIDVDDSTLVRYELPSYFYDDIDFSSFQPYMSYKMITDRSSQAYKVSHSKNTYVDSNGLLRYETTDDQFTIDGNDDYVIALGTYYKEKGTCGSRYLVVTTGGMYTAITGDEKADAHTEKYNVCTMHNNYAGMIEWLVDTNKLDRLAKQLGTITAVDVDAIQGEILYIYQII